MRRPTQAQVKAAERKAKKHRAKWLALEKKAKAMEAKRDREAERAAQKVRDRYAPKLRKIKADQRKVDRELVPAANRWHRLDRQRKESVTPANNYTLADLRAGKPLPKI